MAITKTEDGRVAAGIEYCIRTITEEGRTHYEPYFVLSWIRDDLHAPSVRQAVPVLLTEALRYVDRDCRLVVFRSFAKCFQKYRSLEEEMNLIGRDRGITVKINYLSRLAYQQHPLMLANDASRRGYTIASPI
ncbi:hypothetical protein AB4Z21_18540 [Paenibacillus sp. MCAF20]